MPAPFAQKGFDLLRLLRHLPVKGMCDMLALLIQLLLHQVDAAFNSCLRGLDLLD